MTDLRTIWPTLSPEKKDALCAKGLGYDVEIGPLGHGAQGCFIKKPPKLAHPIVPWHEVGKMHQALLEAEWFIKTESGLQVHSVALSLSGDIEGKPKFKSPGVSLPDALALSFCLARELTASDLDGIVPHAADQPADLQRVWRTLSPEKKTKLCAKALGYFSVELLRVFQGNGTPEWLSEGQPVKYTRSWSRVGELYDALLRENWTILIESSADLHRVDVLRWMQPDGEPKPKCIKQDANSTSLPDTLALTFCLVKRLTLADLNRIA